LLLTAVELCKHYSCLQLDKRFKT